MEVNVLENNLQIAGHTKPKRLKTAVISNENCCVYGCKSVRRKNSNLMYHSFPHKGQKIEIKNGLGQIGHQERMKIWEAKLRMGKKPTKSTKVCSLHFSEDNYTCSGWSSIKRLKPTAVPNQNLPTRSHSSVKQTIRESHRNARQERHLKRQQKQSEKSADICFSLTKESENAVHAEVSAIPDENVLSNRGDYVLEEAVAGLLLLDQIKHSTNKTCTDAAVQVNVEKKEVEVQVNTSEMVTVCDFVKTDKQLSSCTGINSFLLLNTLVSLLQSSVIDKKLHKLSLYKRIFLTFMKIKLDLPYVILSILFGVSSQTCKTIFFETIVSLTPIAKCVVTFPYKEKIQRNVPKCFKHFKEVSIIVDCTEIAVQRDKRLCCRNKCYSHYKGTTLKFLTGVTPAGLISYVSPAYGGRTADKAIFERSGLLNELDMFHDDIMVDKGFLIESLCESFGIGLIRPPFLRKKTNFSQFEAIQIAQIDSARVHIERSNQKIKSFKMMSNRLPANLIPIADNIFVIVCAIVNLANPIFPVKNLDRKE